VVTPSTHLPSTRTILGNLGNPRFEPLLISGMFDRAGLKGSGPEPGKSHERQGQSEGDRKKAPVSFG
jgi:hypothetical protein